MIIIRLTFCAVATYGIIRVAQVVHELFTVVELAMGGAL